MNDAGAVMTSHRHSTQDEPAGDPEGSGGRRQRLPFEAKLLATSGFLVAMGFGIIAPALPAFAQSFHVRTTAVSLLVSAFSLLRLCFAPISGRLISRFGAWSVYGSGLLVVAATATACAYAQTYQQLLVIRALGGAGAATFHIAALTMLFRLAPSGRRGRAYALWAGCFLLGTISGPILGSLLMNVSLRLPFLTYGAILVVAACVVWVPLRHTPSTVPTADNGGNTRIRQLLRHPTYQASVLANFTNGWTVHGMRVSLFPLFVTEQLRRGHTVVGVALSLFAVGYAAALTFSGRYSDQRGRKPLAMIGLLVGALGTAAIGFTTSVGTFMTASVITGIGAGLGHPAQGAAVADLVGGADSGATGLAGYEMSSDVGAIVGPLAAGALADSMSFGAAFLVTGTVAALGVLSWVRASETRTHVPAKARAALPQ